MLLAHKGVKFEDNRIGFPDWPAMKPKMPGGQVPVLELSDGTMLNQTQSILRYIGKVYGYYSIDPMEAYLIDNNVEYAMELLGEIYKPQFSKEEEK